jgi:acetyl-CoA carboxylase beta subunit
MKTCKCGKLITAKDKRNKDGLQAKCNDCYNEKRRLVYKDNPDKFKERQKKYNDYALTKAKKHIETISDTYVIAELKRGTNLTTPEIRNYPELIEAKRQIIKNKRLCKTLKNCVTI